MNQRKQWNPLPQGRQVNLKARLLANKPHYIPDKYVGKICKISRADVTHFLCHFNDGYKMWVHSKHLEMI